MFVLLHEGWGQREYVGAGWTERQAPEINTSNSAERETHSLKKDPSAFQSSPPGKPNWPLPCERTEPTSPRGRPLCMAERGEWDGGQKKGFHSRSDSWISALALPLRSCDSGAGTPPSWVSNAPVKRGCHLPLPGALSKALIRRLLWGPKGELPVSAGEQRLFLVI